MHKLKKLLEEGFGKIFSANLVNKIVQFGTLMVMTRVLGKSAYGEFSYAQNQLSLILLLEGLGAVTGILQYCSHENKKENVIKFFKFGLKLGFSVNIILSLIVIVYANIGSIPIENSGKILKLMFGVPLLTVLFNSIQMYLRATFHNSEFSKISMVNSLLYFMANIILGYFYGVYGIVIGIYLSYIISIILGIYYIKQDFKDIINISELNRHEKVNFIKYSLTTSVTNAISQLLYLIDTYLVGMIIKNEVIVAGYKVSTLIPFNLTFIPMSVMVFYYPYFAKNKDNFTWLRNKIKTISRYLFYINGSISIFMLVFSKYIVTIVFGNEYIETVPVFRILIIGFFISGTLRIPYGNILASMGKVKANLYNSLISGISNIVLDIYLIKRHGMIGAAIATLIVFIISSGFSVSAVVYYLKRNPRSQV